MTAGLAPAGCKSSGLDAAEALDRLDSCSALGALADWSTLGFTLSARLVPDMRFGLSVSRSPFG